eukprot:10027166-Karenia_brevis.AAC.1
MEARGLTHHGASQVLGPSAGGVLRKDASPGGSPPREGLLALEEGDMGMWIGMGMERGRGFWDVDGDSRMGTGDRGHGVGVWDEEWGWRWEGMNHHLG